MAILLARFVLSMCAVGLSLVGLMYGWGLEPQSWPWIIGSGIGAVVMLLIAKELDLAAKRDA